MVVELGATEAKIESIFNDFVQVRDSNKNKKNKKREYQREYLREYLREYHQRFCREYHQRFLYPSHRLGGQAAVRGARQEGGGDICCGSLLYIPLIARGVKQQFVGLGQREQTEEEGNQGQKAHCVGQEEEVRNG